MKKLKYLLLMMTLVVISSCGEEDTLPESCLEAGEIILTVENGVGSIKEESGQRIITYFIPGTIDSFRVGVVCNNEFPDFLITEESEVRFSGHFRSNNNPVGNVLAFGDNSIDILELTFIEDITGDN
ncbi:hypothetical protein [Roseivirga sp. E12]|uniref:hypothetical protein n=1 Tax=Roseivirga sp. E12 TaxID=2819237 RepID=UPI001ABD1C63|nr:hypothetical protein [Roseivirga sp. E12]MBO3698556.1 hypothetical protein [Roseivirga sp. E12]